MSSKPLYRCDRCKDTGFVDCVHPRDFGGSLHEYDPCPVTRLHQKPEGTSGAQRKRLSRPALFMAVAELFGQRSSCPRANVGAVAVLDRRIIATGYVGAPSGLPHCDEAGCTIGPDEGCVRTIHAEANLVAWAARTGTKLEHSIIFCTHEPCLNCARLLGNVGIKALVWKYPYRNHEGTYLLQSLKVHMFPEENWSMELENLL